MPNLVYPRARRRRLAAVTVAGTLGAALLPALFLAGQPASATPTCAPAGYTASASADLLKLNLLDVGPLGLSVPAPLANITIGHATADMARAVPDHATGQADYLSATLAGITVPSALLNTHAREDAPPPNAAADTHSLVALNSGLLDLGVGNVSAFAGKSGVFDCGLATGDASVANAAVLPGLRDHSLLALPDNLNGKAGAGMINVGGHLASGAGADAGLADLEVFAGTRAAIGVKVVTEPTLKGIATGDPATSSVTYTSPVLDITAGSSEYTLDSAHTQLDLVTSADAGAVTGLLSSLNLPILGQVGKTQVELRLTLGDVTKHVTGTHVSGDAATLRVELLLVPADTQPGIAAAAVTGTSTLLDLGLGVLSVDARAPKAVPATSPSTSAPAPCGGYGYGCPASPPCACTRSGAGPSASSTPTPTTTVKATSGGSLPTTGSKTIWVVGAGVGLLLVGRLLMIVARRRMSV